MSFKRHLVSDPSVPLLSMSDGSPEKRRKFDNENDKFEIIGRSGKVIPAEYKLIRTSKGIERVLVPSIKYISQPGVIKPLRKLKKPDVSMNSITLSDTPPPLVAAYIHTPAKSSPKVEDEPNDNVVVLEHIKKSELMNFMSNMPPDILQARALCVSFNFGPRRKTLHERFTLLSGKF